MDQGQERRHVLPDGTLARHRRRGAEPRRLQLWTEVNGERRQDSNTSDLIFGIDHIVSYVSHFMTL
jgi:2-keto-4-pentenoate hydratase/2-oxohepta-3-ene-1,7-dioic acid hydratase in catechol pathway